MCFPRFAKQSCQLLQMGFSLFAMRSDRCTVQGSYPRGSFYLKTLPDGRSNRRKMRFLTQIREQWGDHKPKSPKDKNLHIKLAINTQTPKCVVTSVFWTLVFLAYKCRNQCLRSINLTSTWFQNPSFNLNICTSCFTTSQWLLYKGLWN